MNWFDGDKVYIIVVVKDIFNKILNDMFIIYRDFIFFIIKNFWLIRGDRFNISVYRLEDFIKMM